MIIRNTEFKLEKFAKPVIMGILNVTPDSFSDGGRYDKMDAALFHVEQMIDEGADIIDIGGESTRPGSIPVNQEQEITRTAPVIEAICKRFDVPISIDSYRAGTAEAALKAGADIINDVWGCQYGKNEMAHVAAKTNAPIILMHNRTNMDYNDFMRDVLEDMVHEISICKNAGVKEENIIVDPGVGFAKNFEQNLEVMKHLEDFHVFKLPILLGISNKSVIGNALNLPVDERLEGTIAMNVLGFEKGCCIFRVHDVKANKRALDMAYHIHKSK